MNAEMLLNELLALRSEGVALEKFEVIVKYTEYDSSIPYDMGKLSEVYPDIIRIDKKEYELILI
jgi:hypothetical protein